jgi:hypothetical protein
MSLICYDHFIFFSALGVTAALYHDFFLSLVPNGAPAISAVARVIAVYNIHYAS